MRSIGELAELLRSDRYRRKTLADGSGVLLDVAGMRVLSLNRTAVFVLDEIARGVDALDRLEERLTETFEVGAATAARDLRELLGDLDRKLSAADASPDSAGPAPGRPEDNRGGEG